jgi:acyl-coenzyme A synthetase/AMP-(fatty) acid ligase
VTGTDLLALDGAPRITPVDLAPDRPAFITHSSGTTGVPKLMVHTARTLGYRLLPQQILAWPARGREPVLLAVSVVHSRFFHSLGVFLSYGNPVAVADYTSPDTIRAMLLAVRPGVVETHPNNFMQWEEFDGERQGPLSSVRFYSVTFDALHPGTTRKLLRASRRRHPMLLQVYGQSECGPLTWWPSSRRSAKRGRDARCIGYPMPSFVRLRVVDNAGRPVPHGTIGQLQARTRGRIRTYLAEDERFSEQLDHGWWSLGDVGWRDRRGRIHLADREVDQISDLDSSLELEDVLLDRLPDVCEVVIIPSDAGPPVPYVATRDDHPFDRSQWAQAVAGLPELEKPVQWRFNDFPRTGTWKIRRLEMREMLGTDAEPEPVPEGTPAGAHR